MTNTQSKGINFSPFVYEWAKSWKMKEPEYLHYASQFGTPLVKRVANYILTIVDDKKTEE